MAKKKPAAKIPAKKPVAKAAAKNPVAKAPPKKVVPMAKKAPAKKVTPPVKKAAAKKAAPAPKKAQPKSLKETVLKAASKIIAKATKPALKEEKKAKPAPVKVAVSKEKTKALALKEKEKEQKDKARQKELDKKQKEQEKERLKAEKEAEKAKLKASKKKPKSKKDDDDDDEDFDDEDLDLGPDDEPAFGEERKAKKVEEDDGFDEFEEEYKKSKANKKGGKKAYEVDDVGVEAYPVKQSKKFTSAALAELESSISDEISQLREHFNWKEIAEAIGTMDFFIDAKNDECIEKGCDNIRTTQSYCRLHYLRNWKVVQKKREILKEGKLQEYIEELILKYPTKYIESLLSDLSDDKEFYRVLNELNITSEFDFEEDEFENAVDDDDSDDDIGIETISSSLRYEDE